MSIPREYATFLEYDAQGTLHFDVSEFLKLYGYADTPANRNEACRAMAEAIGDHWPGVPLFGTRERN